jgi:hypothetical protein
MDAFSYLSVLLSIVLGLGLTQIVTATGTLIRHHGLFAVGCVSGMLIPVRRYQEVLGIAFAVALLVYIGVLFARLH